MELIDVEKPKLYSMNQVATHMGVSYMTLYRMVKNGKIKAYNIASTGTRPIYAFRAEDVQAYYYTLPRADTKLEDIHQ